MKSGVFVSSYIFYFLSYMFCVVGLSGRQRRYLLFTPGTQWGAFVTVSVPLHPQATVSVAWFFEANYYNVANATYFEPLLGDVATISRNDRSIREMENFITRRRLYEAIEAMLEKHLYPGRPCLLRSICEHARSHYSYNGLVNDLIHLVLTTSTSVFEEDLSDCYYEAEFRGLEDDCSIYTDECPEDPLDKFILEVQEIL